MSMTNMYGKFSKKTMHGNTWSNKKSKKKKDK